MSNMNWDKPRKISIVVDNESWILPYTERLIALINENGDHSVLVRKQEDVESGDIAFYLGCIRITPQNILDLNGANIVVHASNLPKGRGFAPVAWQILEGKQNIPICLLEMAAAVDSGPIVYRDSIELAGHELHDEWRDILGNKIIDLCLRYLKEPRKPQAVEQEGESSIYARRRPKDSELDPEKTIADQFDLLRVVDNSHYPAFFSMRGKKYKIKIEKVNE
jgi:methionyl-tRNA formyltransferase